MNTPIENKLIPVGADIIYSRRNGDTVPGYASFRVPAILGNEIQMVSDKYMNAFVGNAINKLGWIESWDITLSEMQELFTEKGIKRR